MTRAPSRAASAIKLAGDGVDLAQGSRDARIVRTEALQVVVEMREVDERSVGERVRRTCKAASAIQREAAIDVAGPQNWNSGNGPSALRQLVAQLQRLRVAVRQLAAVRPCRSAAA